MDKIIEINSAVNGFVWGPIMLALLVGTGIYLSFRVGFIQFSKIGYWWKNTIGKIFQKSEAGEGEITPMQAVSTALASTVGTGNIAGVTGAIILGGPGAVFWMWISALFGMVTKFAEVTLAVKYRERNEKGDWCGGPMYYIKNGLGPKWKWLGVIFSVFGALAAFGIGNISQINSIASSVNSVAVAFHENAKEFDTVIGLITGVVIAIFVALVLLGGVKRIEDGDTDAGDQADEHLLIRRVLVERDGDGLDGVRDGVDLRDVADAERRDGAEHGEHGAEPLPLGAKAVFDVVHGTAYQVTLLIPLAEMDSQRHLCKFGTHTKNGRNPHPEHSAWSSNGNGSCYTGNISCSNCGRQSRTHRLKWCQRSVRSISLAEHPSDGSLDGIGELADLQKTGTAA